MLMTFQDFIDDTSTPLTDEQRTVLTSIASQEAVDNYGMTFASFTTNNE